MKELIRDIMTRDVESAEPDMTVRDAARLMRARNIGSLPVCEGGKVIGMVTDRDITIRAVADGRDPASTRVDELMSRQVVSVREDSPLGEAERLMHDQQLRRLPVVNGAGELVGYLALAKIALTELPEQTGKVIQGVSHSTKPAPMDVHEKHQRAKPR
ncbi:MAG TPA: CBS domain-containing protein [Planctomycetota bacterium]|nr:CBS domain-containing protein [Planctomycetota bacterium]